MLKKSRRIFISIEIVIRFKITGKIPFVLLKCQDVCDMVLISCRRMEKRDRKRFFGRDISEVHIKV